jgi:hypothetical protein
VCRRAQGIAVDHGVAEHYRADAGGIAYKPVYRHPGGPLGCRLDGCRLVKDPTGRLAHGKIGHDAAAAAMEEGLAGTFQSGNQRLDRAAVIAAGGIDDRIGSAGFGRQERRIVERPDDRIDAVSGNRVGLGLAADEPANPVAICDEGASNRAADETARAGKKDSHFRPPDNARIRANTARCPASSGRELRRARWRGR